MEAKNILIVLGTGHVGRKTEIVANLVLTESLTYGFNSELIDVKDWLDSPFTGLNQRTKEWQNKVENCDGLIIVSPEYNRGYPGELKLFLDQAYKEYHRKPVALVGVSSGPIGGARGVEQLRLVCNELHMAPLRTAVYFKNILDNSVQEGKLVNEEEYKKPLADLFADLDWWAKTLKAGRVE